MKKIIVNEKFIFFVASIIIIIIIPIIIVWCIPSYFVIAKIDPTKSQDLRKSLDERAWIFSVLNIGRSFPYYDVSVNFDGIDPAVIQSVKVNGQEKIVNTIPYDSLTCMANKLSTLSDDKVVEKMSSISWSECKFKKDFRWGYASSDKMVPRIDIRINWYGIVIIFFASLILWCGFLSLIISTFTKIYDIFNKIAHK